jgi:hypothetical protein
LKAVCKYFKYSFPWLLVFTLAVLLLINSGCAGREVKGELEPGANRGVAYPVYPKASPDADRLIVLQSNKDRTSFYVDGKFMGKGNRLEVMVSDRPHTITSQADGHISKENFIQPPYLRGYAVGFDYQVADRFKKSPPPTMFAEERPPREEKAKVEKQVVAEKVVERPVEKIVEKKVFVDRPVEKIVEKKVFVDRPVEKIVEKQVFVDRPVEKIVEKKVFVDRPVEKIVEKQVFVDRPVEKIVEKQVMVDRPVEKQVFVDRPVEKQVIVEKYIDRPVKKYAPPSVEIIYPHDQSRTKLTEVELKSQIAGEGDIKKVAILVNGQEIQLAQEDVRRIEAVAARNLQEIGMRGSRAFSMKVPLIEGRNIIMVQAIDETNNLAQATISIIKEGKDEVAKPLTPQTKVWLLAVGVSKYQEQKLNLQFADADARTLYNSMTDAQKGTVNRGQNSKLLLNEQANRVNILLALNNIFKQAFDEDFVVLYMAMHGMVDPDGSELYFVAHDTHPSSLVATGISQSEIEKAIAKSKVGKVLLIVDTCHSGSAGLSGVFAQRALNSAASVRLLNKIADIKKGVSIFTASSSTEFSQEHNQWGGGHGVFTHYLVEGLSGKADENKDEFITLRELYDYTYRRVKEDTKGNQHPEMKGTLDSNIPLAEVKRNSVNR